MKKLSATERVWGMASVTRRSPLGRVVLWCTRYSFSPFFLLTSPLVGEEQKVRGILPLLFIVAYKREGDKETFCHPERSEGYWGRKGYFLSRCHCEPSSRMMPFFTSLSLDGRGTKGEGEIPRGNLIAVVILSAAKNPSILFLA